MPLRPAIAVLFASAALLAAAPAIKLRVHTPRGDSTVDVPLERYVAAVVAGEGGVLRSEAARQALAVAARTYAVRLRGRHSAEGFDFCDTTHCQRADLDAVTPAIEATAAATAGDLLWFEGSPAFTPYSRDCGGRTEDAAELWPDLAAPYLRNQADPYCLRAGSRPWQWSADPAKLLAALARSGLRAPRSIDRVEIVQRTPSGRARTLLLGGAGEPVRIAAGSFHAAVGRELGWNTVQSERYEVHGLVFQGSGSGHGVGLCQRGADQMGTEGRSYREILAFYYPGTAFGATARGIAWQRLGGRSIALFTTEPDRDGAVLALAERLLAAVARRTQWPVPAGIEVRVYPTVDAFRNSTGEPGWVAAHTDGRRIHLQPAAVLRAHDALDRVLRHELIHVLMEARAAPDLPVWFREGLAQYLDPSNRAAGAAAFPADSALRQTADPAEARRAYADSLAAVTRLVERYGEGTVLGWVEKRGQTPFSSRDTNASPSQPAANSK
jgi:stage II sporulation protein D